ncbi:MAG TPA: hypothetical protein PKG54_16445 [Phycisphaerae bacterium]|nr:hypothetical protein [Phycisphaerae bacterium]
MRGSGLPVWAAAAAIVLAQGAGSVWAEWAEPDWESVGYTSHSVYQAVDANGMGTFWTFVPVKMRGVILNRAEDMLDTRPGANPGMGGQWQVFVQTDDPADFGGTAMWLGQNVGKTPGHEHPRDSYSDEAWLAEVARVSRDPATGRAFRPGDRVEIRARASGLFRIGKTNINEQHSIDPQANFDVILLEANAGLPAPQVVTLADLKDASDKFIFDQSRATGPERYQGTVIKIENVSFVDATGWQPEGKLVIHDGTGRTFPVLLGRGQGFTRFPPPAAPFDIIGIVDQEDEIEGDGYKDGYRLWAMNYDGEQFFLERYVKPDLDRDTDVDGLDLELFLDCETGPAVPQDDPACRSADFDGDGDVDQDDFGIFQRCFVGTDGLVDPLCDR